jgi:hypothetical protein
MTTTGTAKAKGGAAPSVFPSHTEYQGAEGSATSQPRRAGYGLPCSNCGTYYSADEPMCPICKCAERISPGSAQAPAVQVAEPLPNADELEEERERFLREFKSQLFSAHMQINAAASFRCSLEENHEGALEPAAICKSCHDHLQQRADQLEAALHIDLKEAAQIVYDAVWSDPSDPGKTYQNAAQALLAEMRKRAGISMVLTTLQPYTH